MKRQIICQQMSRRCLSQYKQSKVVKNKSFDQCNNLEEKIEEKEEIQQQQYKPIDQKQIQERIIKNKKREFYFYLCFSFKASQISIEDRIAQLQKIQIQSIQILNLQIKEQKLQNVIMIIHLQIRRLLIKLEYMEFNMLQQYQLFKKQMKFTRYVSRLHYVIQSDYCKDFIDQFQQLSSEQSKKLSQIGQQNMIRSYSASKKTSFANTYENTTKTKNSHKDYQKKREDKNTLFVKLTQKKRLSLKKKIPEKYFILTRLLYLEKALIILNQLLNQANNQISTYQMISEGQKQQQKRSYFDKLRIKKLQWEQWEAKIKINLTESIQAYEKQYGKYVSYYYLLSKVQLQSKDNFPINPQEKQQIQNIHALQGWLQSKRKAEIQKNIAKATIKTAVKYSSQINKLKSTSYRILDGFIAFFQEHLKSHAKYAEQMKAEIEKILQAKREIDQMFTKDIEIVRKQKEQAEKQYLCGLKQGDEDDVDCYYQQSD